MFMPIVYKISKYSRIVHGFDIVILKQGPIS